MGCCLLLTMVALTYLFSRSKPVYLVDYHCYRPPDRCPFLRSNACHAVSAGRQARRARAVCLWIGLKATAVRRYMLLQVLCCDAGAASACRLHWYYGCR